MNIPNQLLLVISCLLLAWIMWFVFNDIPLNIRSCLRYRIWRLRDRVVDDILKGEMPASKLLLQFVEGLETVCSEAIRFSLFKWLTFPTQPQEEQQRTIQMIEGGMAELTASQKQRFMEYQEEFNRLFFRLLLNASISGWVCKAIVVIIYCALKVFARLYRGASELVDKFNSCRSAIERWIVRNIRDWPGSSHNHGGPPLPFVGG
jgi:hypothetical protein